MGPFFAKAGIRDRLITPGMTGDEDFSVTAFLRHDKTEFPKIKPQNEYPVTRN